MKTASMLLHTPEGGGPAFRIQLDGVWPLGGPVDLRVAEGDRVRHYQLLTRSHAEVGALFTRLARDFGLRPPANAARPSLPHAPFPGRVLLTENLPGIRYGYGDPAVLKTGEGYYLLVTSNDAPDAFPILFSRDLTSWSGCGFVFPQGRAPGWTETGINRADFWAPELHRMGESYRLYFVAREKGTMELCIGTARADHPRGPYFAETQPLLRGNVIDPHVFVDRDGRALLYWKKDNNDLWPGQLAQLLRQHPSFLNILFDIEEDRRTAAFAATLWPWIQLLPPMERFLCLQVFIEAVTARFNEVYRRLEEFAGAAESRIQSDLTEVLRCMRTPIYAQPLSADGCSLEGEPIKVLENDRDWEAHLVEGIWVTEQEGRYFLFYAGNDFSTEQYGIGVAVADRPTGPFRKQEAPFLRSSADWRAPGHPSLAPSPDGEPLLFLHAFFPGEAGYKKFRALLAVRLRFEGELVHPESEQSP